MRGPHFRDEVIYERHLILSLITSDVTLPSC